MAEIGARKITRGLIEELDGCIEALAEVRATGPALQTLGAVEGRLTRLLTRMGERNHPKPRPDGPPEADDADPDGPEAA